MISFLHNQQISFTKLFVIISLRLDTSSFDVSSQSYRFEPFLSIHLAQRSVLNASWSHRLNIIHFATFFLRFNWKVFSFLSIQRTLVKTSLNPTNSDQRLNFSMKQLRKKKLLYVARKMHLNLRRKKKILWRHVGRNRRFCECLEFKNFKW